MIWPLPGLLSIGILCPPSLSRTQSHTQGMGSSQFFQRLARFFLKPLSMLFPLPEMLRAPLL